MGTSKEESCNRMDGRQLVHERWLELELVGASWELDLDGFDGRIDGPDGGGWRGPYDGSSNKSASNVSEHPSNLLVALSISSDCAFGYSYSPPELSSQSAS